MVGVVSVFESVVVIVPVPVLDLLLYLCSLSVLNCPSLWHCHGDR